MPQYEPSRHVERLRYYVRRPSTGPWLVSERDESPKNRRDVRWGGHGKFRDPLRRELHQADSRHNGPAVACIKTRSRS